MRHKRVTCSIAGCGKKHRSRGWCNAHYLCWYKTGNPIPKAPVPLEDRFWSHVQRGRPDECWPWDNPNPANGYGQFNPRREHGRQVRVQAHRFAYELVMGPIPDGLTLDHLCHNRDPDCPGGPCRHRACCNPEHGAPATGAANTLRGQAITAHNARKDHCVNGHALDEGNTYRYMRGGTARRGCRRCRTAAMAAYRVRKQAEEAQT